MTERADILRLQAEIEGIPATPSGRCFWRGIRGEDKNSPRRVTTAGDRVVAVVSFIAVTWFIGYMLGTWGR